MRTVLPINRSWEFTPGLATSDDARWTPVTLPHSNADLPASGFDEADYAFVSTYRRHVRLPEKFAGNRVFVEFDGIMTAATARVDGRDVGGHRGGYTPFRVELTEAIAFGGDNVLEVEVDSTERPDIPPFGGHIDYLTFGGMYRQARLHIVPNTYITDVFARPKDVRDDCRLEVTVSVDGDIPIGAAVAAELRDGERTIARSQEQLGSDSNVDLVLRDGLDSATLWSLEDPKLYDLVVTLRHADQVVDEAAVRTGIRECEITPDGFFLNGERVQLRGLNRHQTFPFVGGAMPPRVQRRDAEILRNEFKCTAVRTSHYPQSTEFLDACDELGLLVFEELPGWQHIGDRDWQDVACQDIESMIRRDRNHPSIFLWGVRINESFDDEEFYSRTNEIAHALDETRQTSGVRYFRESQLLEDVFALNDFQTGGPIHDPHHPNYLVSEYAGHMFPTKRFDNVERMQEHALLHARVQDQLHALPGHSGGFGWCAFDYNTHAEFGSGDRVCYHGVADMFRIAKPAAHVYSSQCDPREDVICEPAFHWAAGDHSDYGGPGKGLILSNCDEVVVYVDDAETATLHPDREQFPHLPHAPFFFDQTSGIAPWRRSWGDLRLEGYIAGEHVITREFSGRGVDVDFTLTADDLTLIADGSDATRLVFAVTDEYGNVRPFTTAAVTVTVEGPASLIGDTPISMIGGSVARWLKAGDEGGQVTVTAHHPRLGSRSVIIELEATKGESW